MSVEAPALRRSELRRWSALTAKAAVGALLIWAAWVFFSPSGQSGEKAAASAGEVLVHAVERTDFEAHVTESGDIESASNVEVRCEVRSPSGAGTTILKIVPEGTLVEKGDPLIQFDDSLLQLDLTQQEILVAKDEAAVIEATSELRKAEQALREYREGTFRFEKETIEGEVFQAQETLRRNQESLGFTERMVRKGYEPQTMLDADQFSVEKAQKDLLAAQIKLNVLTDFTLPKMVGQLEADVEKQKANLKAAEYTLKLSRQRSADIQDQINKSNVRAPAPGQVVYANDFERSNNIVIEEGAKMREGQVVIRLPNPKDMQVRTRINDSKIKQVKVGNTVTIELDVNPDLPVRGEVAKIEPFPYPRQWYGGPIEYGTMIRIHDPPPGITPGQRAKVKILVERQEDVVQVPIQSVVERSGRHYCLIRDGNGGWETRRVDIGSTNGSFVVVRGGVMAGDEVALNPDLLWDDVFVADESVEPSRVAETVSTRSATGS